jgi:beta-lactamase class D
MKAFERYVQAWKYGNMDVSGDPGKNNGLTHAWLSGSLRISPHEQVAFLESVLEGKSPFLSRSAVKKLKKVAFIQEFFGGWKLYGKTGNGRMLDEKGAKTSLQHGWFVGWMERGEDVFVFAAHLTDTEPQKVFASFRARYQAYTTLFDWVNTVEK